MKARETYNQIHKTDFGSDNWCLEFGALYNHALLTSLSNGQIHHLDWTTGSTKQVTETGETASNKLTIINNDNLHGQHFAVASLDSVKIFDVRCQGPIATLKSDRNVPFLSIDSRHNLLACGTELSGVDAELCIYDIKKWDAPLRTLIDSHHDDITDLRFHPSDRNVLLSGSTDGYTNIYDLTQQEEEDCLHQVINFASIHSCGWLSPRRIFTLSHMETFAIHELNDKTDEPKEPQPLDFGDVRESWGCGYVINVYPGFIATGSSQENSGFLKLIPFENEMVASDNAIIIPSAHSDEVIRDVLIPPNQSNLLYTCGEDGNMKIWNYSKALNVPAGFWDYSQSYNVLSDPLNAFQESKPNQEDTASNHSPVVPQRTENKEKVKGKKKSKKAKSKRYQPY